MMRNENRGVEWVLFAVYTSFWALHKSILAAQSLELLLDVNVARRLLLLLLLVPRSTTTMDLGRKIGEKNEKRRKKKKHISLFWDQEIYYSMCVREREKEKGIICCSVATKARRFTFAYVSVCCFYVDINSLRSSVIAQQYNAVWSIELEQAKGQKVSEWVRKRERETIRGNDIFHDYI